ncbi:MAG: hypothetical protein ABIJ21_01995 [Nanoarchaeota archaeon]
MTEIQKTLADKVAESEGFPKVYFGTTEALEDVFAGLGDLKDKDVLLIAGSGDAPISALVRGADVTAVDISERALQWTELKCIFGDLLEKDEYRQVMNALNPNQRKTYDLSLVRKVISRRIFTEEFATFFVPAFESEESLSTFRNSFFYTTRNYLPRLSPHSFVRPDLLKAGNLMCCQGDIMSYLNREYDLIYLSNVSDVFFAEGHEVRFYEDGSPDYSCMPAVGDPEALEKRGGVLKKVRAALRPGGKAASFSFGYYRPFIPDFISTGKEAGFRVQHVEVESDVYGSLMDHILVYEKS